MRNQVAWCYEHEDAYKQRSNVQGYDGKPVEFYRNGTYIIGLCIEFDDACKVLEGKNAEGDDVAQKHTLADDEDGKPQEGVADGLVAGTQCLHYAYHGGAFQNDDEQTADHGDTGYYQHQTENNPDIQIHQAQPLEDVWIQVLDGRTAVGFSIVIYRAVHLIYNIIFCLVEFVEVVYGQFCTACLVFFPSVQFHGSIEVGVYHYLIILLQVGLIDTLDGEAAHTHCVVIKEVGKDAFSRLQLQLISHQL